MRKRKKADFDKDSVGLANALAFAKTVQGYFKIVEREQEAYDDY